MFKKIKGLSLLMVMVSSTAIANPNAIYIEQVGETSTITVTQTGQNNTIGSENDRFVLGGNAQDIIIVQSGSNNVLSGRITNAAGVNYNVNVTGNSNENIFNTGSIASVAGTTQNMTITGDNNFTTFNQGDVSSSTNALLNYVFTGDFNTLTTNINTDDVINTVNVTGDQNTITTTQNGYAGKNIEMNVIGSLNTINIDQKSTTNVDTLKLDTTGTGSTINITQCNISTNC
jgi:hypothetical protein